MTDGESLRMAIPTRSFGWLGWNEPPKLPARFSSDFTVSPQNKQTPRPSHLATVVSPTRLQSPPPSPSRRQLPVGIDGPWR
jgi:hypothetical protein